MVRKTRDDMMVSGERRGDTGGLTVPGSLFIFPDGAGPRHSMIHTTEDGGTFMVYTAGYGAGGSGTLGSGKSSALQ